MTEAAPLTLGSAGVTYGGLSGKSGKDFGHGTGRFVTFVEVMRDARLWGRELASVDVKAGERQNEVRRGDVLFNGSSETPEEVALAAVVDFDVAPRVYLNSFCFGYRLSRTGVVDPTFLAYFFRSHLGRQLVVGLAQGSTRYNIAKTKLLAVPLVLPEYPRQQSIAAALMQADGLVACLDRLITKKRAIKQGMMQELLVGSRLPGFSAPWHLSALGAIATVTMGQAPRGSSYNTSRVGMPLIQGNADIKDRKTVDRLWTSEPTKRGRRGDVILTVRAPVGYTATAVTDICLGRGVCSLSAGNATRLLFHALLFAERRWSLLEQGSTFTAVNSDQVRKFGLMWPDDLAERIEIARILDDADLELEVLERRLEVARDVKQGMMQELLTGRTRLSVEGDAA